MSHGSMVSMGNKGEFHKKFDINCNSGISSVVTTENFVFVGLIGEESNVNVYSYKGLLETNGDSGYCSPRYVLENNHGGISKLVISPCKNLILGVTCYGWIYIWDIGILNNTSGLDVGMNDGKDAGINGETQMIKPRISFVGSHPGDSICVDFVNSNIIVTAGINPGYSISFISAKSGKKIAHYISKKNELSGLAWPFYFKAEEKDIKENSNNASDSNDSLSNKDINNSNLELAIYSFTNIAIERSSSSGGCWIALGSTNGFVTVIYLPFTVISRIEKHEEKSSALENDDHRSEDELNLRGSDILWKCHQVSELSTEIRSLSWRPRNISSSSGGQTGSGSNSICLVCGTCDSLLRYCFIETEDKEIAIKRINLVKITDGTSNFSEINSISFSQSSGNNASPSPIIAVAFNKLSSSKRHPIMVSSDNSKKMQPFSSFNVYVQDTILVSNDQSSDSGCSNGVLQTYFYCIGVHHDLVTSVYVSPCCSYIASSSIDGHLHIYTRSL